jgi:HlyD family type I secretion membrane fusion protein
MTTMSTLTLPDRPTADLIEHDELRRLARWGRWILGGACLMFFCLLFVARIEGAVVGNGQVKVDLNRKQVQHAEGGIVRSVRVRDGQHVTAGELLIELSDVTVDASAELVRSQYDVETMRSARLVSERAMAAAPVWPVELLKRRDAPAVREIFEREQTLFKARRETLNSQIDLLTKQIAEVQREAAVLAQQTVDEKQSITLQREELKQNEDLEKQGFVQRTRVITLQRAVQDYAVRNGDHEVELARARQKANDLQLRIISLRNEYVESANRDLRESSAKLAELEQRLRPSEDAARRQRITAPVTGEIVGMKPVTTGGVVSPRDVLMEIVPTDARLIVEAKIQPKDITQVAIGAEADVRLTAFTYRTTPVVIGRVETISADVTTEAQTGATWYTVRVAVSPQDLKNAGGDLYLQAGMPADVYIKTRSRTVASYLFEPVTSFLRRAMRES